MRKRKFLSSTRVVLFLLLIAVTVFAFTGCDNKKNTEASTTVPSTQAITIKEIGEGSTEFSFNVMDSTGMTTYFSVKTDKKTVGDALIDVGLIDGDKGEYGLYVTTVNGITKNYDIDGAYWAFYINDEYASSAADLTDIDTSAVYSFRVEQA